MKRFLFIILIFLLTLELCGCAEKKVLEQSGLITTIGYDKASQNKISSTIAILQIDPDAPSDLEVVSNKSKTIIGNRIYLNLKSSKALQSGQLRVALFSEDLAHKGLRPFVETFARVPDISDLVYLAIVEGSTKSMLQFEYKNIPNIGQYLFKEIEQNIEADRITSPTIHEVTRDLYSVGDDPILPILKKHDDRVYISGTAILRNDKMVGRLSNTSGTFLNLLRGNVHSKEINTTIKSSSFKGLKLKSLPKEIPIVIDTINSKKNIQLVNKKSPEFSINLKINARLLEVDSMLDLNDPEVILLLEKAIGQKIKEELIRVIQYCKERNSDVFGFGEIYRSSVRNSNLSSKKWHEMYKSIELNTHVDFSIIRTGLTE